ncbi:MAG: M50 family metallopeptidase [Candidatus Magasanikbacteria bacterium]|nr:M50 family metallopeptidase [Candidatus Magasanikbacteria bacterium]
MLTLIIFIAVLAVLVLSHEAGHFFAARKSGMKVYEFGFGFPPRAFGWYKDHITKKIKFVGKKYEAKDCPATLYSVNWLPLGGFVSIRGEDGQDTAPDSFQMKGFWPKASVIVSGVVMNIILAGFLFSFGYMFGLPQVTDELPNSAQVENRRVEILQIISGKPAEVAGLKEGDVVIQVGSIEYPRLKEMQEYVNLHQEENISVSIKRGEEIITNEIKPFIYKDTGKAGIGVAIAELGTVSYPWYLSFYYGFKNAFLMFGAIAAAFYGFIKGLFVGTSVAGEMAGPVGIAIMTGKIAKLGFIYLLQFTAILSLNLAFINILPIPALDGGRLLFLILNKINKKLAPAKFEQIAHSIGFMLLMLLIVVVTVKDLTVFKGVFINLVNKIF